MDTQARHERAERRNRALIGWQNHLILFFTLSLMLLIVAMVIPLDAFWILWALSLWAVGLISHGMVAFVFPRRSAEHATPVAPGHREAIAALWAESGRGVYYSEPQQEPAPELPASSGAQVMQRATPDLDSPIVTSAPLRTPDAVLTRHRASPASTSSGAAGSRGHSPRPNG